MNAHVRSTPAAKRTVAAKAAARLVKRDANVPALRAIGRGKLVIRAGTVFFGRRFRTDTPVNLPALEIGGDYFVNVPPKGAPFAVNSRIAGGVQRGIGVDVIGGFHFAPGGNAKGNRGGDATPAINPNSVWDVNFRPACPDPRGMTLVEVWPEDVFGKRGGRAFTGRYRFWCDIYLTASDHLAGTSRFGVTIADGGSPPEKAGGERHDKLDYATAVAVLKHHRKQLLSAVEFFAAARGVTERTAAAADPVKTGLDAPRTSNSGCMQITGNLYQWGHDGHALLPRASIFGGYWWRGADAGSRHASLAYPWPEYSNGNWGARGRSDHLQPA
jgi:hypothetical protein